MIVRWIDPDHLRAQSLIFCLLVISLCFTNCAKESDQNRKEVKIYWQAHRGGGAHDAPDNTMAAFLYTWKLGGIPEADIRSTRDGVIVCLHDETLARTTTAPTEIATMKIAKLDFAEIRQWDAGSKFSPEYSGEKVPSLEEVLNTMAGHPQRELYMDIKQVDLAKTGKLIDSFKVGKQILVASPRQSECKSLKALATDVRSMLWIGGSAEEIAQKFALAAKTQFDGLDQVQLHLNDRTSPASWRYQVEPALLQQALQQTRQAGVDLEVFVMQFAEADIHALLDLGIRWYATDEPKRFSQAVDSWRTK